MRMAIELFNAHLDGHELTSEQSRLLSEWVKADPANARSLVLIAQIHESLDSRMCVPRMLEDLTRIEDPELRDEISESLEAFFHQVEETSPLLAGAPPTAKSKAWMAWGGLAAAALFFLALLLPPLWHQGEPIAGNPLNLPPAAGGQQRAEEALKGPDVARPAELVATVAYAIDTQWNSGGRKGTGTQLLQGEVLDLKQGIVTFTTTVGHAIVVEGPARLMLESPQELAIEHGKVVGRVGIHGGSLEVSTPTATIHDLGTEFGVEVTSDRLTNVAVYDGVIELKGKAGGDPVRVEAGVGRSVTNKGSVLEEIALPHDRQFVRLDEVDLRIASQQGDDQAKSLATYYKLVRSGTLLGFQGFHASSRGKERTIGLNGDPLRSTAPLILGADLHPSSPMASGGLRLDGDSHVFLHIDTRPSSPMALASKLNDSGQVGKDGTEMWIAWRAQLHGPISNVMQYGGLSLTLSDTDDNRDTYLGRVHNRNFLGVQFNHDADEERHKYPLDMAPKTPGEQPLDADQEIHRWVVHLKFTAKEDHIRVWLDVPSEEIPTRQPNFSRSRDQIAFDRIRLGKSETSSPWTFDEVMLAATLDDLIAADRLLQ